MARPRLVFFAPLLAALLAALPATLLAPAPAFGQRGGGLSSFPLLQMDASARAAAMGGAFSAVYDGDAGALFYHPALPNERSDDALSATYLNHLADLNAGFLAYSHYVEGLGTTSAGLRFFSYGDFDGRDGQGYETGSFGASDVALTLGLSRALSKRVRYGANVHLVHGSIEEAAATALAADLGVLYHLPAQQFAVSASVNNLGDALDGYYGGGDTALPLDVQLGVSKRLTHLPLRLAVTGFGLHDWRSPPGAASSFDRVLRHLAFGAELAPVDVLALRVGYGHRRHEELQSSDARVDAAGLSAGFGLTIRGISVDYAFSSWSALGGLHQFGLRAHL